MSFYLSTQAISGGILNEVHLDFSPMPEPRRIFRCAHELLHMQWRSHSQRPSRGMRKHRPRNNSRGHDGREVPLFSAEGTTPNKLAMRTVYPHKFLQHSRDYRCINQFDYLLFPLT